jgi:ABC-type uncharacterized transport system auxiliary subunit
MKRRVRSLLTAALLVSLTACGGTPHKDTFYRLPDLSSGDTAVDVSSGAIVYLPPFEADGLHGERALVYAHDDGTALEQYTYHYWVDSPRVLLQQALAERLRGAHRVVTTPSAEATYTLRGRIRKFERHAGARGATAEVSLEFELLSADTELAEFVRAYQRSVPLADDGVNTCASALGQAAQDVLANFATDLEAYWGR